MTAVARLSPSPSPTARRGVEPDWARLRKVARMVIATMPEERWYDVGFLSRYEAARHFLALVRPDALQGFVDGMARLHTRPDFTAKVEPAVIDRAELAFLVAEAENLAAQRPETHELERFGRIVVHDHLPFTDLALRLAPLVSRLAGEEVEPSYNFLSLYGPEGRCGVHLDEPQAKWTLDLCLAQDEPWPLQVSRTVPWPRTPDFRRFDPANLIADPALGFTPLVMGAGDGVLFSGSAQWHYRAPRVAPNPRARARRPAFCHLLFLHYRPARSLDLVKPRLWASHFDLPELAALIEEFDAPHSANLRPGARG